MIIEYEATFTEIDKDEIRARLKKVGARLIRPEFMQKRAVFGFPPGKEIKGGFIRVRDEGDKVTLTLKIVDGDKITDQKEICINISDFNSAVSLLSVIGCAQTSYEESKRELWMLENVEITIDDWPHLYSIVEVEGHSEEEVKIISERLDFDWSKAKFCAAGHLYVEKYGMGPFDVGKKTGKICELTFEGENPFLSHIK